MTKPRRRIKGLLGISELELEPEYPFTAINFDNLPEHLSSSRIRICPLKQRTSHPPANSLWNLSTPCRYKALTIWVRLFQQQSQDLPAGSSYQPIISEQLVEPEHP